MNLYPMVWPVTNAWPWGQIIKTVRTDTIASFMKVLAILDAPANQIGSVNFTRRTRC